jgi:hypothetical protein
MAKVTIRPTIPSDLAAVIDEPLPFRIRAYTALLGDTVLGVGGVAFPGDGLPIAFVQQSPEAKSYPVSFHRAGLMAMRMIEETGVREVMATCDPQSPAAIRWLERLGFVMAERQTVPGRLLWCWVRRD